jgi:hypothetical protein
MSTRTRCRASNASSAQRTLRSAFVVWESEIPVHLLSRFNNCQETELKDPGNYECVTINCPLCRYTNINHRKPWGVMSRRNENVLLMKPLRRRWFSSYCTSVVRGLSHEESTPSASAIPTPFPLH